MNENIPNINEICIKTEGVAGAGKTTEAIKAIQEYSASAKSKEKGVLMFSLTNATIQNLLGRLKYAAPCYTVHSFCLKMLKAQAALTHTQAPKVLSSETSQKYLMKSIMDSCPKDDPEEVVKAINQMRSLGKARSEFPERYGQALDAYRAKLDAVNAADFPGIIERAYAELQKPEVYQRYDGLYVMCDESQDFNPHFEWQIIDILRRRSHQFMLYSSPSQEIYSFCGANYKLLCETLPDYTETRILNKSHRCVPEIVEVAKHLGGYDASLMESCLDPSGYPAAWYESVNHSLAIRMIVSTIEQARTDNPLLTADDFAILARSKSDLAKIAKELGMYGLETRMVGSDPNIYKAQAVQRFLDYLTLAITGDERLLDNIFNYPNIGIIEEDMIPVRGARRLSWSDLKKVVDDPQSYAPKVAWRAKYLLQYKDKAADILSSSISDEEKICKICEASGILGNLRDNMFFDDMKRIQKVCDNISLHSSLDKYYQYMVEQVNKDETESNGVNLCNFHSSKGREWKHVFLIESEKSSRCMTPEAEVQARNTAYVAATRAMDRLIISTESESGFPDYLSFMKKERQLWL